MSEHLSEEKGGSGSRFPFFVYFNLRMSFFKGTSIYALKGGIDHLGRKISSGHYVLNIKVGGEWLVFNDTKVTSDLNFGKRNIRGEFFIYLNSLCIGIFI